MRSRSQPQSNNNNNTSSPKSQSPDHSAAGGNGAPSQQPQQHVSSYHHSAFYNSRTPVSPSGPRVEHSRGQLNGLSSQIAMRQHLPLDPTTTTHTKEDGMNGGYRRSHRPQQQQQEETTTTSSEHLPVYPYSTATGALDSTTSLRPLPGRPRRKRQGARGKYHRSSKRQSFCKRCYARWIKGTASSFSSLVLAVALWYGLGVVSIATSKLLLTHFAAAVPPLCLTLQQLFIGTSLLRFLMHVHFLNCPGRQACPTMASAAASRNHSRRWSYVSPPPPSSSSSRFFSSSSPLTRLMEQLTGGPLMHSQLLAAGIFFSLGFLTTNYAFAASAASFVETVKAAEPISSAAVAWWGQIEVLGQPEMMSLATIVVGVALSTLGNDGTSGGSSATTITTSTLSPSLQASLETCAVVFCANLCFSFRGLYQKLFRASGFVLDDLNLQYRMQQVGVGLLVIPALLWEGPAVLQYWWHHHDTAPRFLVLSIVNGLCFTGYNLASTFILTRISVVHHAALNCLRRVFAIICTSLYFSVPLSFLGWTGIGLSTAGFLSFNHYKVQRQRQPKPLSSLLPVSVNPPPA